MLIFYLYTKLVDNPLNIGILSVSFSSFETISDIFISICTFKFNTYPPSFCRIDFAPNSLFYSVSAIIGT